MIPLLYGAVGGEDVSKEKEEEKRIWEATPGKDVRRVVLLLHSSWRDGLLNFEFIGPIWT